MLLERSRDLLLKAIDLDPNDALAYSLLALAYFALNDFDRGVAVFDKALELNPNDPDVLFHVANVCLSLAGRKRPPR